MSNPGDEEGIGQDRRGESGMDAYPNMLTGKEVYVGRTGRENEKVNT